MVLKGDLSSGSAEDECVSRGYLVSLFEPRWACPRCCCGDIGGEDAKLSDFPLGRFLSFGSRDPPPASSTERSKALEPCDWCHDQGLESCDMLYHGSSGDHAEEEDPSSRASGGQNWQAKGAMTPEGWEAGRRTRVSDLAAADKV